AVRVLGIVGGVDGVLLEGNRVGYLARFAVNFQLNAQRRQPRHEAAVELGYRHRPERQLVHLAVAGRNYELVINKIELDFEGSFFKWNRRRGKAARTDVKRH